MEIPKELLSKEFLSQFKSEEDVSIQHLKTRFKYKTLNLKLLIYTKFWKVSRKICTIFNTTTVSLQIKSIPN